MLGGSNITGLMLLDEIFQDKMSHYNSFIRIHVQFS